MFRSAKPSVQAPRTAPGERVYAIGDIHGRFDLLKRLLAKVKRHWVATRTPNTVARIVILGDVIDRGPQSAHCLALIAKLDRELGIILLRGNHEDLMIESAESNGDAQRVWLENGGEQTLASFGLGPPQREEDAVDFAERLQAGVPDHIWRLLRTASFSWTSGDYFFAHAGVRPRRPLEKQHKSDLIWVREEFTSFEGRHGAVIVHGHSIVDQVELRHNRIACDTGAYRSGVLSCICLEDEMQSVLTS